MLTKTVPTVTIWHVVDNANGCHDNEDAALLVQTVQITLFKLTASANSTITNYAKSVVHEAGGSHGNENAANANKLI